MVNNEFGLPPEEAKPQEETEQQRIARLRARAQAQAEAEFDEDAVFAKFLAEARDARAAELAKPVVEFQTDTQGFPEDYDKIEIAFGGKEDVPYVPLGINGFVIKVPRGTDVIVPHLFVTDCLDQAIENITIRSQGGLITRPQRKYPYQFKGKASKAEYQAFQAEQKEKAQRETRQAA